MVRIERTGYGGRWLQVGEETDKTHSTEYHIAEAKHVTKSELLESRASMLATTLHHVKVLMFSHALSA